MYYHPFYDNYEGVESPFFLRTFFSSVMSFARFVLMTGRRGGGGGGGGGADGAPTRTTVGATMF